MIEISENGHDMLKKKKKEKYPYESDDTMWWVREIPDRFLATRT